MAKVICAWTKWSIVRAYQVERLRQEIRERFIQALPEHAYTGVLVALAVGDQRAIPREQWKYLPARV